MPLSKLMNKLRKSNSCEAGAKQAQTASDMDCIYVTAEVVSASDGRRSPCHSLSRTSQASSSAGADHLQASPSSRPVLALPQPSAAGQRPACPVTRAQRAKVKAAHRTLSLNTEAHPAFFSDGSGDAGEQQHSGGLVQLTTVASLDSGYDSMLPYHRAATAPLTWTSHTYNNAASTPGSDDGDDIIAPAASSHDEDDEGEQHSGHCQWEDEVVASWLKGIDTNDLLHTDNDADDQHGSMLQQQSGPCKLSDRTTSNMSVTMSDAAVFGSLLYN
eukprot:gene13636-13758_t